MSTLCAISSRPFELFSELLPSSRVQTLTCRTASLAVQFFQEVVHSVLASSLRLQDRVVALVAEQLIIWLNPNSRIIQILFAHSADPRIDVMRCALPIITLGASQRDQVSMSRDERGRILHSMANIPSNERALVTALVLQLVDDRMNGYHRNSILMTIAAIPFAQRESTVALARSLLGTVDRHPIGNIIETIQIAQCVVQLTPAITEEDQRASMVEAMLSIPSNERERCIAIALQLLDDGTCVECRIDLLETIAALSTEECEEILQCTLEIVPASIHYHRREAVFCALLELPANERRSLTHCVGQLITESMSGYDREEILQTLATVDAAEREDVTAYTCQFMAPDMEASGCIELIECCCEIPFVMRGQAIELALSVVTEQMTGYQRIDVLITAETLLTIETVPVDQREGVLRHAIALISFEASIATRTEILTKISHLPSNERAQVIDCTCQLITPVMEPCERVKILNIVIAIPIELRATITRGALFVITESMNGYYRRSVLLWYWLCWMIESNRLRAS